MSELKELTRCKTTTPSKALGMAGGGGGGGGGLSAAPPAAPSPARKPGAPKGATKWSKTNKIATFQGSGNKLS